MSNPYLERLRGRAEEKTETQHPSQPSKPPKPSFDSFGGDQSMCFFENEAAEEESENLKNASPRDRQNRQNLDLPAEPNAAYRATSVGPDGVGCKVEIVELPQAPRYRKAFGVLQLRPPALVPVERWKGLRPGRKPPPRQVGQSSRGAGLDVGGPIRPPRPARAAACEL